MYLFSRAFGILRQPKLYGVFPESSKAFDSAAEHWRSHGNSHPNDLEHVEIQGWMDIWKYTSNNRKMCSDTMRGSTTNSLREEKMSHMCQMRIEPGWARAQTSALATGYHPILTGSFYHKKLKWLQYRVRPSMAQSLSVRWHTTTFMIIVVFTFLVVVILLVRLFLIKAQ
jgi:hypothetical protein